MSAWIVDKTTIDLLITAGLARHAMAGVMRWRVPPHDQRQPATSDGTRPGELNRTTADAVGSMLWAENYASVLHLYPEDEADGLPGPAAFAGEETLTYEWEAVPGTLDPVVVLASIACYEYQSCEHDGWHTSQAHAFCLALKNHMIRQLPGFSDAPWGLEDRAYFLHRTARKPS